jgi:hypothetical protein
MISREDPLIIKPALAHTRAMRCCHAPSFSINEAASEAEPNNAVARKNAGAWIRFERKRMAKDSGVGEAMSTFVAVGSGMHLRLLHQ